MIWIQAQAHAEAGETDKAIERLQHLLRVFPEDPDSLDELADLLPADRIDVLTQALVDSDKPFDHCLRIATGIDGPEHRHVIDALQGVVDRFDEEAPIAAFLRGLQAEVDNDFEVAADEYLSAARLEIDSNQQSQFQQRFISAMATLGQLPEAYRKAPAAQAAFNEICVVDDDDGFDLTSQELLEIVEAHYERLPTEPLLDYHRGRALARQGHMDEAIAALRHGLAATEDEDLAETYRWRLRETLCEAGRDLEAYETVPPAPGAFRHVAQHLLHDRQLATLKQLTEAHRQANPNDAAAVVYAAEIDWAEGRHADAIGVLLDAISSVDQNDRSWVESRARRFLVESNRWREAYELSDGLQFRHVAGMLEHLQRYEQLAELITVHEPTDEDRFLVFQKRLAVAWNRLDYGKVTEITGGEEEVPSSPWQQWRVLDGKMKALRSYLRLKRLDEARQLAVSIYQDHDHPLAQVLYHLHAGDVDQCQQYLAELVDESYDGSHSLGDDADAAPFFQEPRFQGLRDTYPRSISYDESQQLFYLLWEAEPPSAGELVERLEAMAGKPCEVVEVSTSTTDPSSSSWIVRCEPTTFVISTNLAPLRSEWQVPTKVHQTLQATTSCIAVGVLRPRDSSEALSAAISAAHALTEGSIGVYFATERRFVFPQSLASIDSTSQRPLAAAGDPLWLEADEEETSSRDQDILDERQRVTKIRELSKAFGTERYRDQDFLVQVRLRAARSEQTVWMRLLEIPKTESGYEYYLLQFPSATPLAPYAAPGVRVVADSYQIVDWKTVPSSAVE